jgi:hypothetical protein
MGQAGPKISQSAGKYKDWGDFRPSCKGKKSTKRFEIVFNPR